MFRDFSTHAAEEAAVSAVSHITDFHVGCSSVRVVMRKCVCRQQQSVNVQEVSPGSIHTLLLSNDTYGNAFIIPLPVGVGSQHSLFSETPTRWWHDHRTGIKMLFYVVEALTHHEEWFAVLVGRSLLHLWPHHACIDICPSHVRPWTCPKLTCPP